MGWLVVAVLSAFVCGAFAASKKRNVFVAVFVGLVLSVVGIIIYAFIPTATLICPKCGEPNATTRTLCKECNAGLLPTSVDKICEKGMLHLEAGYHNEAIQEFNNALQINPQYSLAMFGKACSAAQLGRKAEMLMWLADSIAIESKFADLAKTEVSFKQFLPDADFRKLVGLD